jgi:hypothetical protein
MHREHVEQVLALLLTVGLERLAQDGLGARVVELRVEDEPASLLGLVNRPAREDLGDRDDVVCV